MLSARLLLCVLAVSPFALAAGETPAGDYCGEVMGKPSFVRFHSEVRVELALAGAEPCLGNYRLMPAGEIVLVGMPPQCLDTQLRALDRPDADGALLAASFRLAFAGNRVHVDVAAAGSATNLTQELCHATRFSPSLAAREGGPSAMLATLPSLNIDRKGVVTAGCSHAADFAEQFHVAFSSLVSGSCIFSGQPYHCAVHKFARDYLVPQTNATGVPNCDGCPDNMTLLYDHCKNHPEWVDVGDLVDYPRRACGQNPFNRPGPGQGECIDDVKHLYDARSFVFHPTHDRCYLPGAMANTVDLFGMLMTDPGKQIKFVNDQPFPHTLPTNSTPYFNHSDPAGYDGPGECLRFVYGSEFTGQPFQFAGTYKEENHFTYNQSEFVDDWGVGLKDTGEIYIPTQCRANGTVACKLLFMLGGTDPNFAKYAETNNIVMVGLNVGGYVDRSRFPNACEIERGLSDVYGQLSADYAMQSGYQMRVGGRILRRVMGLDSEPPLL